jgi:amidase
MISSFFSYGREMLGEASWEAKAAAKRASTLAKIPPEWLLDKKEIEKGLKQRNLTGPFIEQYLSPEEVAIIHQGSTTLVEKIRERELSAVQVTRAFCKTAAIAHQIVSHHHRYLSRKFLF